MKRLLIGMGFLLVLAGTSSGQLRKQRLFKVDPASGLFNEIRVAVEYRIKGSIFAYVSPFGFHQSWIPKSNDRQGRPATPQKYYGIGTRLGVRKYFSEDAPKGFFIQPSAAYKYNRVNRFSETLQLVDREGFNSLGLGFNVGWQNLFGPKKNFAYGIMGGLEYFRDFGEDYESDEYLQNWYEFSFINKPAFFNGFRLYLGIELGFAFLQKNLHW